MGCVSSKVGQKPPEQFAVYEVHKDDGGRVEGREESRPALPVIEAKNLAASIQGREAQGRRIAEQAHSEELGRAARGVDVEGGETITDVSGLQMRTPRTCADPGLHLAARSGDLSLVQAILDKVNSSTTCGNGAKDEGGLVLESAVPLTKVAGLDERGMWGNTPLLVATQYAHQQVALALISAGANVCLENERRATALHFSCAEGLSDVSLALLNSGANVDPPVAAVHHPGVNGGQTVPLTPLSAAAIGGHTELVRLLVQRGAEVDRRVPPKGVDGSDKSSSSSGTEWVGGSALTAAARYGHTKTCLLLIDSGASMILEDWDSRTPLLHAILGGHEETAMALLDGARSVGCLHNLVAACEPERGVPTRSGLTLLHAACDKGLESVVKAMVAAGAKVESRDANGASALLHACRKGRLGCVRELLSRGANPRASDNMGDTPLSAALRRREEPRGQELLDIVEAAIADAEPREGPTDTSRPRGTARAKNPTDDIDESKRDVDRGKYGTNQQGQEVEDLHGQEDVDELLVSDWCFDEEDVLDNFDTRPEIVEIEIQQKRDAAANLSEGAAADSGKDEDEDVIFVGDYDRNVEDGELAMVFSPVDQRIGMEIAGTPEPGSTAVAALSEGGRGVASREKLTAALVTLQVAGESVDMALTTAATNVIGLQSAKRT